jgi:hypothetical protein
MKFGANAHPNLTNTSLEWLKLDLDGRSIGLIFGLPLSRLKGPSNQRSARLDPRHHKHLTNIHMGLFSFTNLLHGPILSYLGGDSFGNQSSTTLIGKPK